MAAPLEFYFDFYSPYGYLASLQIEALAQKRHRAVVWRPFLLGPAFAATGHRPLLDTPLMAEYCSHDFARCARRIGASFKMPEEFPKAALAPSRAYYWLFDQAPDQAKAFAQKIYQATFGDGRDGTQPELVAEIASELEIDSNQLLDAIQQPDVKERLKTETNAAMERGVFGSPFIFVDGEPFWGNDRLDQIDQWLSKGGW